MNIILELLKQHMGKSITFVNLATIVLIFWAADKFYFNVKYCLAEEAAQTQQMVGSFIENQYRKEMMLIELKPQNEWTAEERAVYKWNKEKLDEFLKKKNN